MSFTDVAISERAATDMLKEIVKDIAVVGETRRGHMLESVSFAGNGLAKKGGDKVAPAIVSLLASPSCTLRSLDLSFNRFDDEEWMKLAEVITACTTLTYLDVRQTLTVPYAVLGKIGEELLRATSECKLKSLRCNHFDILDGQEEVNLEEVPLHLGPVTLLAGVLKHNEEVTTLNLSATGIDDEGMDSLLVALQDNSSLEMINLRYNRLAKSSLAKLDEVGAQRIPPLTLEY